MIKPKPLTVDIKQPVLTSKNTNKSWEHVYKDNDTRLQDLLRISQTIRLKEINSKLDELEDLKNVKGT